MTRYASHSSAFARVVLLLLCVGALAGCSTAKSLVGLGPTRLQATIEATRDVNPDQSGRPSPVVVRFYVLRSNSAFERADFFALFDQDAATLGNEMISSEQLNLSPGEKRPIEKELADDAQYIGVMAAYRDFGSAKWRSTYALTPKRKNEVAITVGSQAVSIIQQQ